MAHLLGLLAATDNAPADWLWGTVGTLVFVGLVAGPAAALNARDRRRRERDRQASTPGIQ